MMVAMPDKASPETWTIFDTVTSDDVGPDSLRLPLPSLFGPGTLARDDSRRAWRFTPDGRFEWDGNICRLSDAPCPLALLLEVKPSQTRNEAGCDPMWWRWSLSLEINGIVEEIAEADDDVFGWAVAVEEVQVAARSFASSISAMVPTPFLPR